LLVKRYIRILPIVAVIALFKVYVFIWLSPQNPTNSDYITSGLAPPPLDLPTISWRDFS